MRAFVLPLSVHKIMSDVTATLKAKYVQSRGHLIYIIRSLKDTHI